MLDLAQTPVLGPVGARATDDVCQRIAGDRFVIDGRELALPMQIADSTIFAQVFAVPARAARALLDDTDLQLCELWPGTSAVVLMAVQYRDNPLGNYNEAVISVPAYAPGERGLPLLGGLDILRKRAAHYVVAMPVDQEFTTHAGRFMWGYPKFLAQIDIALDERTASARFSHGAELVFAITTPLSAGGRLSERMHNFTLRGGVVRRIEALLEGSGFSFRLGGARPEIGETHPLARTLRELGLPKRPLCSLSLRSAHAEFGVPAEVAGAAP
jgi:hypothetical protein